MTDTPTTTDASFRLDGKVAIITGAGKGIGAQTARRFAAAGADVALVSRTTKDLEQVAADIAELGQVGVPITADVSDLDALDAIVETTVDQLGGVDVLVNNAGGSLSPAFLDTTTDQFDAALRFTVVSPFRLSQLCVPHMLERSDATNPGASIITIGSMAGEHASREMMLHSVTNAARSQLTRTMAADLSPRIRVNAVLPGAIETASLNWYLDHLGGNVREHMIEHTPMRRNGTPDDIASAVLFLASPASSFMTGKLIEVDGGAPGDLIPRESPDL